jgi:hypothetical protein
MELSNILYKEQLKKILVNEYQNKKGLDVRAISSSYS